MNSEIRTLQFSQGVGVYLPPSGDGGGKITLTNNSANLLTALGWYLTQVRSAAIEYSIYRRTDSGFKWMTGKIKMMAVPDAVANVDRWKFVEAERSEEIADSGITFSLVETDIGKCTLSAALDNMAGANHSCIMYYKINTLLA